MADKRSPKLDPELRSPKRAKTFPIAQNESCLDVPPTDEIELKQGPQRRSTTPLPDVESTDSDGEPETAADDPPASLVEDVAHDEANERPSQSGQDDNDQDHGHEVSSSSHEESGEDRSDASPAERGLKGVAEPHDHLNTHLSSTKPARDVSSPDHESSKSEVEEPIAVSEPPDTDTHVQPGPWSPPPEPLRPPNPYTRSLSLTIYRHEACPPFGPDYGVYDDLRDRVLEKDLRQKTLVDLCVENPPMEGDTDYEDTRKLEIVEELRVKSDGGAQLVVCRLDEDDEDYVAKIYDPLYYGFSDTMWPDLPRDVTFESDMDYCREVAAYEEMDQWVGGTDVPKFHGSWTFQMPLSLPSGRKITRDVRMILIEKIPGKSMLEFDQHALPESERLETLARLAELISRISFIGIHHHDISQRNIMICEGDKAEAVGRIALIDFNMSTVERLDDFEEQYGPREPGPDKPANPLDRWWGGGWYGGFFEWLPDRWEKRLRPLQDWMFERWGKSEDFAPPVRELVWDEENQPRSWIAW